MCTFYHKQNKYSRGIKPTIDFIQPKSKIMSFPRVKSSPAAEYFAFGTHMIKPFLFFDSLTDDVPKKYRQVICLDKTDYVHYNAHTRGDSDDKYQYNKFQKKHFFNA